MKEGYYVRTIYGIKKIDQIVCGQDVRFDNTDGFDDFLLNYHNCDGISINSDEWKEIVIGEPKEKPIDLIRVGDYVNGYLVYKIKENCVMVGYKCFKTEFNDEEDFLYQTIYANEIKSIITKEQFESMEYRVGE